MNDQACPLCGTPYNAYGTPGCGCAIAAGRDGGGRGEDARARDAGQPRLIRPYVVQPPGQPVRGPEETDRLPLPRTAYLPSYPAAADVDLFTEDSGEGGAGGAAGGGAGDFAGGDGAADGDEPVRIGGGAPQRPSRRAPVVLAAAGAVVVLGGGALAFGLLTSGGGGSEPDRSDATRTAAIAPTGAASVTYPTTVPSSSASASASASASPSKTSSAKASPSAARSTKAAAPPPAEPTRTHTARAAPPTLRRGSTGPEVTELQLRLKQLGLYIWRADGVYDGRVRQSVSTYQVTRGVHDDDRGVYGPETRRSLEADTREP